MAPEWPFAQYHFLGSSLLTGTPHCLTTWLYTSAPNHWGHLPMPAHRTHGKKPCSLPIHPHPEPQASQCHSPLVSTTVLDSSRGHVQPLLCVSSIAHGQLLGTWSLKPTPNPQSAPLPLEQLPVETVHQRLFLSSPWGGGGCQSAPWPQGEHSLPASAGGSACWREEAYDYQVS